MPAVLESVSINRLVGQCCQAENGERKKSSTLTRKLFCNIIHKFTHKVAYKYYAIRGNWPSVWGRIRLHQLMVLGNPLNGAELLLMFYDLSPSRAQQRPGKQTPNVNISVLLHCASPEQTSIQQTDWRMNQGWANGNDRLMSGRLTSDTLWCWQAAVTVTSRPVRLHLLVCIMDIDCIISEIPCSVFKFVQLNSVATVGWLGGQREMGWRRAKYSTVSATIRVASCVHTLAIVVLIYQ